VIQGTRNGRISGYTAPRRIADRFARRLARAAVDADVIAYATRWLSASMQGAWYMGHGAVVRITAARRGRYGLGACHANAGWLARRWPQRYVWWTGYALTPGAFGGLDNHSWVCRDGQHIEVTYDVPAVFYLGVPIEPAPRCGFCGHPNDCTAFRALGRHP
jgi:hypothetical protein